MTASQPPSTFEPAAYLQSLGRFGVQLGLDRMLALLQVLDRPQQSIPAIHIAGTNGKGSVCAMMSTVLAQAGYTVGRYTSPHLVSWQERICINGKPISAADWQQVLWRVKAALSDYPESDEPPTQFEIVTAAAWLYFHQQDVDVAVLEVGLGGRLDATNAGISPCLTAITPIGRDHWQRLGDTLTEIAGEKAGIIKPTIPVVCSPQVPEALAVITQTATDRDAPLVVVSPAHWKDGSTIVWQGQSYELSLLGDAQLSNAAVVLEAIAQLRRQGWSIPEEAVQAGLADTRWLGRLQWAQLGNRDVLLDGAHNVPAAEILRRFVDRQFPSSSVTWCMGMLTTKDASGIFQALLRSGDRLYTLPIQDHLAFSPDELLAIATETGVSLQDTQTLEPLDDLKDVLAQLPATADPIVICGSLYMLGQLMERYPQLME
ncbi:MAG: folylpolyglutamate synthase/dihydrofolate synthase family protein [Synechococcus sp.]